MISSLVEKKALVVIANAAIVAPGYDVSTLHVSSTIAELIGAKIDSLPPFLQTIVKVCSVIGVEIPFDALFSVFPMRDKKSLHSLRPDLLRLCEAGILTSDHQNFGAAEAEDEDVEEDIDIEDKEADERENFNFTFVDKLTRDIVYSHLLFSYRAKMHRRLAKW